MRKYTLLVILLICSYPYSVNSQVRLSVQPGLQIPLGDFSNTAAVGFGGEVSVEFLRRQRAQQSIDWSFTGMVGYHYFTGNKDLPEGEEYTYSEIPIRAGIRYYLGKGDFKTYIGAELGFHLLTISSTFDGNTFEASSTYFGFAPVVGFRSYFTRSVDLDINLKLNSISSEGSSLSYIGFNFGVQFAL